MGFLGISWDFNGIERGFSEIEWDSHHGMTYFRNPKKGWAWRNSQRWFR
jgi:hypothetical protein